MATTYKTLGQVVPVAATATTLYTVPAATSAVCSTLVVCNRGGAATTFRVSVRVAGAAADNKQYLIYDSVIEAYDTITLTLGITLAATDVVTVYSGTADTSYNLFGSELT